jgi:hypothetical protein
MLQALEDLKGVDCIQPDIVGDFPRSSIRTLKLKLGAQIMFCEKRFVL